MDDQLKQLFDYTQFHIGMYTTLATAIIAVFANDALKKQYVNFTYFIKLSILCFFIAGIFGGLVASSIPDFKTYDTFIEARLGPWNLELIRARICIHLEHLAFWAGCLIAIIGLFRTLAKP